jgi:hypothetical protein
MERRKVHAASDGVHTGMVGCRGCGRIYKYSASDGDVGLPQQIDGCIVCMPDRHVVMAICSCMVCARHRSS